MRVRTVLIAMTAGLYACAFAAVLVELGWIHPTAWITSIPFNVVLSTASYTLNPFIEEIVKVLPLAMLLV